MAKSKSNTHPDMTVHDQADTQETVDDGVVGAARDKRGDGERNKTSGKNALECPVVGSVALGGRREGSGVVHGALVDSWSIFSIEVSVVS